MKLESILREVVQINKKFEQIDSITGRDFNVFYASGTAGKELMHENFIAELLNVDGSHKQGDIFLKLFLKEIGIENKNIQNPDIYTEYVIDNNRRIDIVIKPNNNLLIAIEIKIFARDQQNQIIDYYNYLKDEEKCNFELYYLTLFGNDASIDSKDNLIIDKDYQLISFKYHILPWIEKCISKVAEIPFLRDALMQYKILLENLTNSNRSLGDEIVEAIGKDEESIKAASEIVNNYYKVWAEKEEKFFAEIYTLVEKKIKNWEDGDSSYFNLWYDSDSNDFNNEEIIYEFKKKIVGNKERGICFIRDDANNNKYYAGIAWFSDNYLYLLVAKKDDIGNDNVFFEPLDELLLPLKFEKYEKDSSYFKFCDTRVGALKSNAPSYELFNKDNCKKLAKEVSKELIELIKNLDRNLSD